MRSDTYIPFLELRTRPAHNLLAAIPQSFRPEVVYDLGCGPGNSTILLKERWPKANIIGFDESEDMLKTAKATYPEIHFITGDIAHFTPHEKIDFLFANASLQWVREHAVLIPRLFNCLNVGGIFAIQVPNNFHAPSHQVAISILESKPQWQSLIDKLCYEKLSEPKYQVSSYYDLFSKMGATSLLFWETEYYQEMAHINDIFAFVKGTGLWPALSNMNEHEQKQFEALYIAEIAKAYPLQANGKVLFPFRRVFMVVNK